MENGKITIRKTSKGYDHKPTKNEMRIVMHEMKQVKSDIAITYEQLAILVKNGYSVLLAEFKKNNGVEIDNIKLLDCIALDIDSKENKITMKEMIKILKEDLKISPVIAYRTFSDTDNTKFRLIYKFESSVDYETYTTFYKGLQLKYKKYLDQQTKNPNRVWAGTNKEVYYNKNDMPINFGLLVNIINWYDKKKAKEEKERKIEVKKGFTKYEGKDYIRPEHKKDVLELLINNISLKEFLETKMGARFRKENGSYVGRCVIHGGDNTSALVVTGKIWTCFTQCNKTGNLITVAKKYYNTNNFSEVAFSLARDYNILIDENFIRRVY